jgi:hypothetical protein
MMARGAMLAVTAVAAATLSVGAQEAAPSRSGPRRLLEPDHEIALARSAAPEALTAAAAIYVLGDSGYAEAVAGTNGMACYVSRSWPSSLEPHCFDAEGAATVMRIQMRRTELLHRGTPEHEADRLIGADLASGRFRLPRRPALSYMMSGAQVLINDSGRPAGRWQPHLMIYYPYLTIQDLSLAAPDPRGAMLSQPGSAVSSIVVVLRDFLEPAAAGRTPR